MAKRKKSPLAKAKDKAWIAFSKYIRTKYAVNGECTCVTCGVVRPIKEMQAGHFIGGRNNTVLFDERLVYPQCYRCNCVLKGNYRAYTLFMLKKHTIEEIEDFELLKLKIKKMTIIDFNEVEKKFKLLIKNHENDMSV